MVYYQIPVIINFHDPKNVPKEGEEKIIDWLRGNGYEKEANEIIIRNAFLANNSEVLKKQMSSVERYANDCEVINCHFV